jgi:hypothetical protein
MEMDKHYKPELIVERTSQYSVHKYLYLDTIRGVLVATNGHMLIKVPVDITGRDVSGFIPAEVIERARDRANELHRNKLFVKATTKRLVVGTATFDRPFFEKYPDYEECVIAKLPSYNQRIVFGVDMNYIDRLRSALGMGDSKHSCLFFSFDPRGKQNSEGGYEDTIQVFLQTKTKSFEVALIMPRRWYNNNSRLEEDMSFE